MPGEAAVNSPQPLSPAGTLQGHRVYAIVAIFYVAAVLLTDAFASMGINQPFDWTVFSWDHSLNVPAVSVQFSESGEEIISVPAHLRHRFVRVFYFDYFKFVLWFLIPFLVLLPHLDWGAFGFARWKRSDAYLLSGLALAGLAAVLLVPLIPALSAIYQGSGDLPWRLRVGTACGQLTWIVSWLLGWELLHRYLLLKSGLQLWPRFGWLLVPLSEGLYHLQKPGIEALGMVLLSLVLTQWAMRRQNVLLPFLAHLVIEVELVLLLVFL